VPDACQERRSLAVSHSLVLFHSGAASASSYMDRTLGKRRNVIENARIVVGTADPRARPSQHRRGSVRPRPTPRGHTLGAAGQQVGVEEASLGRWVVE
jgi:hypothetical protein